MKRVVDARELMDADDLDAATYAAVLADLDRANGLSFGYRATLRFLNRLVQRHRTTEVRLLDVGSGSGRMLFEIDRWRIGRNCRTSVGPKSVPPFFMLGIDLNPRSEAIASARRTRDDPWFFETGDYAALAGRRWDVIVSSLVAHHMSHSELVAFIRFMEAEARLGWLIADLRRSRIAQWLYRAGSLMARLHPIVRHDGALSVARSYTADEWKPILADAGVTDARIERVFPFRLSVSKIR